MSIHPTINPSTEFLFNNNVNKLTNDDDDVDDSEVSETEPDQPPVEQTKIPQHVEIILILSSCIFLSFMAYNAYHRQHVNFFDPNEYLEPCNATDAPTILELQEMKEKLTNIQREKNKLYESHVADKKLIEKLSNTFLNLEEHYITQKAIRLNCYKDNLYPKVCIEYDTVLNYHAFAEIVFTVLLFYLAAKHGLLKCPTFYALQGYNFFFIFLWVTIQLHGFEPCRVPESYVKEFPV